jgi:hypothetical protein
VRLIIYGPVSADAKAFIEFWSARYTGDDDDFYEANVGQELTEARILDWFEWKNGTPLSGPKRCSVLRNFVARREELASLQDETPVQLLAHFSEGGVIWRIFWLHCWQPKRFPIYDQHVHRAMRFIETGVREEIPARTRTRSVPTLSSTCLSTRGSTGCLTGPWTRRCGRSANLSARITFRLIPFYDRRPPMQPPP